MSCPFSLIGWVDCCCSLHSGNRAGKNGAAESSLPSAVGPGFLGSEEGDEVNETSEVCDQSCSDYVGNPIRAAIVDDSKLPNIMHATHCCASQRGRCYEEVVACCRGDGEKIESGKEDHD